MSRPTIESKQFSAPSPTIERWGETWRGLGVGQGDDGLYADLVARYSDRARRYHTLHHLDECFARLDEARNVAERVHEIEFALWFHDAIYDVRRQDNEERSAQWARDVALRAGVSVAVADRVHALIMVTKHDGAPAAVDEELMVDVDLAILGAPVERFDEYERQVREEYSWVPGWLFRGKRREILRAFLSRPRVFNTEYFIATYEKRARANLERSITALGG